MSYYSLRLIFKLKLALRRNERFSRSLAVRECCVAARRTKGRSSWPGPKLSSSPRALPLRQEDWPRRPIYLRRRVCPLRRRSSRTSAAGICAATSAPGLTRSPPDLQNAAGSDPDRDLERPSLSLRDLRSFNNTTLSPVGHRSTSASATGSTLGSAWTGRSNIAPAEYSVALHAHRPGFARLRRTGCNSPTSTGPTSRRSWPHQRLRRSRQLLGHHALPRRRRRLRRQ